VSDDKTKEAPDVEAEAETEAKEDDVEAHRFGRDSHGRDSHGRDGAGRDSHGRDSHGRNH